MKNRKNTGDFQNKPQSESEWVVGIGASAGGLEALTSLIANLPSDFHHPLIIAQHLAPHAKSMMVELLQRHTKLPIVAASNQQKIEPQTIYIVPPNHDIDLVDHHILLTLAGIETRPKPSIDDFFQSLASAYGSRAIGVVLSGTGSDGSEGIKAIKAAGGYTFAQDDRTAKYDGMPRSAVSTGDVDSILSPEEIAKALPQILKDHDARLNLNNFEKGSLDQIFKLIVDRQGTDFSKYKSSTINRRIAKQMVIAGAKDIKDYISILKENPRELAELCQQMLVSVTTFFRDPDVFESIGPLISKIVGQKQIGEEIRVWVAGCATGEEAYTLAILFAETLDYQKKHLMLKVFATDLDQDALLEARNGVFEEADLKKLPPELVEKYFQKRNEQYEVSKRLREIVVFARQDLTQNPPFVKLDFISCRNVLIYFEQELQKRVIEIFHYALNPSGVLLLGKSESVSAVSHLFEIVDRNRKVFMKVNIPSKVLPSAKSPPMIPIPNAIRSRSVTAPSIAESSYLKLLNSYGISGVTVDENCNIIQIIGDVSPFLGFFNPQPDFRLTNLLPKGVGVEIPILIRKAKKDGKVHRSRAYNLGKPSKSESFYINVRSLSFDESEENVPKLYIIDFERKKKLAVEKKSTLDESELPSRVSELEHELFVTREHLQTVVEELGVSNEELQSLNEELSSTNEELQASSEELETTNEELQSSNEELTTVNEELNTKQTELRTLNISFENVQNSLGSPMVILDDKNRIIRFNPESTKIFRINSSDIGREITKISSNVEIVDFNERLKLAQSKGKESEALVYANNTIYQLRVLPCFDERKNITGAILVFFDNTEFLRTQEKLTASETRLKSIINGSNNLIFLKDTLGRYVLINDAFKKFFNLEEKEVIGKTDRELFNDKVALPFRDADLEVMVKRTPTRKEESVTSPDGREYWFLSSRFPLIDSANQTPYAIGTVAIDITNQVKTKEELYKSESRYKAIVEDQAVFVCRHDVNGKITFVNSAFAHQFGGSTDLNIGQPFQRIISESERARVSQELASITVEQPIVQYEHRTVDASGSTRWIKWIHRGIFNSSGQVIEFQAVGFDITDSKKKTDQLIERNTIFSSVFDYTTDFISVIRVRDNDFLIESFNRSAAKVLGHASIHLLGTNLRDMLDPALADSILERYRLCAVSKKPQVFEERLVIPGGVRYMSTSLVPIPDESGIVERIASISRDISNYKRAENDLRNAKEEADAANRSKSDFLASMSHELRTPLNVVLGMSQILFDTNLTSEQKNYLASIKRSGDVLLSLIEDVLDVAKIESGNIKLEAIAFDPTEVISDVMELFLFQAKEKNVQLISDIHEDCRKLVIGDPLRLRQILVNLVSNALKFTDKGSIKITATATCDSLADENVLSFTVVDTGIGIAEEDHARLFKRFSQIESGNSRRYGGTGLGLMISKQLVNMMNGSIGFDSVKGNGSKFWFTVHLPLSKFSSQPSRSTDKHLQKSTVEKNQVPLKVLAVDDNPDSRALINLFLKKLGHKVVVAENGQDALEKLAQHELDLILMDIQMPEMDGYEVTAKIRKLADEKSKIPVVALTANAMSGDSDRAFRAGMDDYLTKPLEINALKNLLSKWTQRLYISGGNQ